MSPIQLVIFDMAGTTIKDQHEVEKCFKVASEFTGLKVSDERILALQGYSKKYVFQLLWTEMLGENHPELKEMIEVSYDYFCHVLETYYQETDILPTEGCLEMFDFLKEQKIRIALTTGFYRKVVNIILGKLGWLQGLNENYLSISGDSVIDLSIASDEVAKGRPEPQMIEKVMNILKVSDPQHVINIGDTPSDLKSGIRAGVLMSLGVTNGTHSRQQLSIHRNDGLLNNVLELKDIIANLESNTKPRIEEPLKLSKMRFLF